MRIGLAEIDAALGSIEGVESAVCVKARQPSGDMAVVAFVKSSRSDLNARVLRRELLQRLPPAMAPDAFHFLESWPLAPGGKVDRQALLASVAGEAPGGLV
jgi:acyl-coenzyme A synthetase/AMP-(fatty) acid ligase